MYSFTLSNIDNNFNSYAQIAKFYHDTKDLTFEDIEININDWFCGNMSACLGALFEKISVTNNIEIKSNKTGIIKILEKNGFLGNYGFPLEIDNYNTTIKYLKHKSHESRFFMFYVTNELLSKNVLPKMSELLKHKIAEAIYEIFVNAQMHSKTEFIYTCGQFYPSKQEIYFTIVDTGVGFKKNVNDRFNVNVSSPQAIKWAIKNGHTTKEYEPGGIGLALLTEFIKINKGKFQIISDNGFFELNENEVVQELSYPFPGTIVNMQFKTNDIHSYLLASEISSDDVF